METPVLMTLAFAILASLFWMIWHQLCCHLEFKKLFGEVLPMSPKSHWFFGHVGFFCHFFSEAPCTWTRAQELLEHCNKHGPVGLWVGLNWPSISANL
jgi:hypothetical protein